MTPAGLHEQLIEACKKGNIENVTALIQQGVDPNFNIKRPVNALDIAIQNDHDDVVTLLLEHGAIVKEFVIQKAIEKDKNYLALLIPNFAACEDKSLLMGVLQAAINLDDVGLAKQAIDQGAKSASLFLSSIVNLGSIEMLRLLIENGFNIHADKNLILTEWMGSPVIGGWGDMKHERHDLLAFICEYYLEQLESIEKFYTLRLPDKSLLFRIGLSSNNLTMMKFACVIGAELNEALNAALYRFNAKEHKGAEVDYAIIEYLLNSDIEFKKSTISNAVCFKYRDVLNALSCKADLEYGYEMAYKYENDALCEYFSDRGVSKASQNFAKMKISAIKGELKALRKVVGEGADIEALDRDTLVQVINANQIETLKYLHDSGVFFDSSFNADLDKAMSYHKAFETITYLIELGLDITCIKNISLEYKKKYPVIADMWEKRFHNIFDYTMYLAREVYPKQEGKKKEEILGRIAELSTLPYVIKRSEEKS